MQEYPTETRLILVLKEEIGRFNGNVYILTVAARISLLVLYILTIELIGVRMLMIITGSIVLIAVFAGTALRRSVTIQMEEIIK